MGFILKKKKKRTGVGYFVEKANTVNSYFRQSCKKTNKERYSSSAASISMDWD